MSDDIGVDLDCSVCGTDQVINGLTMPQVELVLSLWKADHAHTALERRDWYRSVTEDQEG